MSTAANRHVDKTSAARDAREIARVGGLDHLATRRKRESRSV